MEFATATFHNSFYFHKDDNEVKQQDQVTSDFYDLIDNLLKTNNPKNWFRAFFNLGLINYIKGGKRFLPCEAGTENFFIEPDGEVFPCNGLEEKYWQESMGNIRDGQTFEELWFSEQARRVRDLVRDCPKNCWMVGTAAPVMKKYIRHPLKWVMKNKLKSLMGFGVDRSCLPDQYDVGQSKMQGDLLLSNPTIVEDTESYPLMDNTRLMTQVIEIEHITDNMFYLTLERCGFPFIPGQSVSLGPHLRYYKNRDYTICSGTDDDVLRFLIRAVKKGEYSQYFKGLKPGDKVDVVGPYGEFWIEQPDDSGRDYLFIAMGVGLGPFLSFAKSYPHLNYKILHGIRTKKDLPVSRDLKSDNYISCISQEEGGGFHGRVTQYLKQNEISKTTYCYICGNSYMLRQTQRILTDKGIPEELIYTEPYYAY
jgi:radical SAM protein with 4Fe4S-binding SPASM domain